MNGASLVVFIKYVPNMIVVNVSRSEPTLQRDNYCVL